MVSVKDVLAEMMQESTIEADTLSAMFTQSVNTDLLLAVWALLCRKLGEDFGLALIDKVFAGNLSSSMDCERFADYKDTLPTLSEEYKKVYVDGFKQYYAYFSKANTGTSDTTNGS